MNGSEQRSFTDDIWRWSAQRMAQAIRDRHISAHEATISCLRRIEQANPKVNALNRVDADAALTAARAADAALALALAADHPVGLLHGVPLSIKDNVDQQGLPNTNGNPVFKHRIAPQDAPQVALLRRAGAILIARSNTPLLSFRWDCENALHGATLNPWDATITPGGSSGGAASAVATGMVPLAHGNDIGGSIRQPAYCCGVAGLRPTVGRVPAWHAASGQDPLPGFQTMLSDGPIARHVGDLRLMLQAMTAYDPRSPGSLAFDGMDAPPPGKLRIGLLLDDGVCQRSAGVTHALQRAAHLLEQHGHVIEEVSLPALGEAYRLWWLLVMAEFREAASWIMAHGDAMTRRTTAFQYEVIDEMWGSAPDLPAYLDGQARRGTLLAHMQQQLEQYPVVLLPTLNQPPWPRNYGAINRDTARLAMQGGWSMMAIALLGLPALSIPLGLHDGLPTGVQLLGRRFREADLLAVGELIEAEVGVITPIDPHF